MIEKLSYPYILLTSLSFVYTLVPHEGAGETGGAVAVVAYHCPIR
jgi:hypothetical protein